MKRTVLLVCLPLAATLATLSPRPASAQACVLGWAHSQGYTIDNTSKSQALSDFEVKLTVDTASLITAGQLQPDAADLRFSDGTTCLPHTIESGLNTASTVIWVRVPAIPANGTTVIGMWYGQPAASSTDDPYATFHFYEGFEDSSINFTSPCGSVATNVTGGHGDLSWTSDGVLVSTTSFPQAQVFVGEASILSASGSWPGLYWALDDASQRSYSVLTNGSQVRIGVSGNGTSWCYGQNWASAVLSYSSPVGLWQLTWVATGDVRASFPTVGTITTTDTTLSRSADLRLMLGGISSGTGAMSVDWVRARRFADPEPTVSAGGAPPQPQQAIPALGSGGLIALALLLLGLGGLALRRNG